LCGTAAALLCGRRPALAARCEQARHDLTEARRDQHRLEGELSQSRDRFAVMADAAPVLLWASDAAGRRTYVNRSWLEFPGRRLEQELGEGWADAVHPDDRDGRLSAGQARRPFEMEYRLRRHDGVYRHLLERAAPVFGRDGEFQGC